MYVSAQWQCCGFVALGPATPVNLRDFEVLSRKKIELFCKRAPSSGWPFKCDLLGTFDPVDSESLNHRYTRLYTQLHSLLLEITYDQMK